MLTRLRHLRQKKGWSMEMVAREATLSVGTVWRMEQRRDFGNVRTSTLWKICNTLGVAPEVVKHYPVLSDAEESELIQEKEATNADTEAKNQPKSENEGREIPN